MKSPKVSILCLTYNQSKYVRQALDSFLMQKTNFEFEILINDDASTDGTKEIIEEYQKKHPKIIKPVFHEKNLYSQGVRNMVARYLLPKAEGRYLALCEGDDYWTDSQKLQLQVDFLDKSPDYALCFHPVKVFFEKKEKQDFIYPDDGDGLRFTINYLLRHNYIQTNSVMYRRQKYEDMPTDITPSDWFLHLYHAQFGKIGFIDRVMSAYRIHPGGIWYNSYNNVDEIIKNHGLRQLKMQFELLKIYGDRPIYRKIIFDSIRHFTDLITRVDKKYNTKIITKLIKEHPSYTEQILVNESKELSRRQALLHEKDKVIYKLHQSLEMKAKELAEKSQQLDESKRKLTAINTSKVWKIRNKIAKYSGGEEL